MPRRNRSDAAGDESSDEQSKKQRRNKDSGDTDHLRKKKLEQEIEEQNAVIEEINAREGLSPSGKITVSGKLYPNVALNIDEVHYTNMQEKNYCVIAKNRSELNFSSI